MDKYESIPLELPSEYVEASNGFSLDIGCSTAKLIYRSKEDYENGKPIKEELKSGTGRVYLIPSIARTELDDVIELIRTKCDLEHKGDAKTEIMTTGAGCNLFRAPLEESLNISLTNLMEFECFVKAFYYMSKSTSVDKLFFPTDEHGKEVGKKEADGMRNFMTDEMGFEIAEPYEEDASAEVEPIFPCIIAMCGSGVGFLQVNTDGTWKIIAGCQLGGRMFLGLSALLTGLKDFSQIYQGIESGAYEGIDEFPSDLMKPNTDGDSGDIYGTFTHEAWERPLMPFGKAVTRSKGTFKDADMLLSLYTVWCESIYQQASQTCLLEKIPNLYFCGNFIYNEKARFLITRENGLQNNITPKDKRVRLEFIKHGGHLGSLGAFMKAKKAEEETEL